MSEKSNAVYSRGNTSFLMSFLGVFSSITCRFSNSITCTGTCLGPLNILLKNNNGARLFDLRFGRNNSNNSYAVGNNNAPYGSRLPALPRARYFTSWRATSAFRSPRVWTLVSRISPDAGRRRRRRTSTFRVVKTARPFGTRFSVNAKYV